MALTLKSKEGRSILTNLSIISGDRDLKSSPAAGRGLVGILGFRLVGLARQIFQDPNAYHLWLEWQRDRVAREFISICRVEVNSEDSTGKLSNHEARNKRESNLNIASLEKLKSQSSKPKRPRVFSSSEFEAMLSPVSTGLSKKQHSGFERFIRLLNPLDESLEGDADWLSQFRNSGQALRIEFIGLLDSYSRLLDSHWNPAELNSWVSIGAGLIHKNDELTQLCQAAEELVLSGLAKEAGFNLALIFALLKGLASERSILMYLIANPLKAQEVKSWEQAITKVDSFQC